MDFLGEDGKGRKAGTNDTDGDFSVTRDMDGLAISILPNNNRNNREGRDSPKHADFGERHRQVL